MLNSMFMSRKSVSNYLLSFVFFIVGCSPKAYNQNCVILESTKENDKPIPVLVFSINSATSKQFMFAYSFILDKKIVNDIGDCASRFSQTTSSLKPRPLYIITLLSAKGKQVKYVNSKEELKELFDCLSSLLDRNNLYNVSSQVEMVRKRVII